MSSGMAVALDVGERRIGVALTSLIARLPAAYTTIDRKTEVNVIGKISDIIAKEGVTELVVGLPRDMFGNETEQTKRVRLFAQDLQKQITIPLTLIDEAVTSVQAEERLKATGKPYAKGDIDAEAAAIILQDYLSERERSQA